MPPRRPTPTEPAEPGLLITAPRVVPARAGSGVLAPGYVRISGGLITEVGQGPPPRRPDLVLDSGVLVPGLVDLQVNGYFGVELMTAGAAGWTTVASRLAETGTTAFMPTFITSPLAELTASLRFAAAVIPALPADRARGLGVHLQGPSIPPSPPPPHTPASPMPP